jgi:hypothetical protein
MSATPIHFNVQNNQPLIPRQQYYTLDRKLVTIHSEDRDVCKWPNANHFEVELPESIQNVQSLRLAETAMPSHFYNISKQFQNNALVYNVGGNDILVEMLDGFYTPHQLACILTSLMDTITVKYDPIIQRFIFYSTNILSLKFDHQICYKDNCDNSKTAWCQPTKWGLGYYLGFDKKEYKSDDTSTCLPEGIQKLIDAGTASPPIPTCCGDLPPYGSITEPYIVSPKFPKLDGEHVIYMELDKYNSYDEIYPHPSKTSNMYLNSYGGKVKSAFAKIPMLNRPTTCGANPFFDSRNDKLLNLSVYDPPIERIQKLKFTFRYHNGLLVDFQDVPFSFSIEFNSLRNDIEKVYNVGVPNLFS